MRMWKGMSLECHYEKRLFFPFFTDGFCSENGPSCCESWSGLVNPGLELLFGKGTTYSKLSRLNDKIRNIRSKIGGKELTMI